MAFSEELKMERERSMVESKIKEKSIHIGAPEIKPGQTLLINRQEQRYFISE